MDYKKIIDAVFSTDPSMPCATIYHYGKCRVYKVDTPEPVVVRLFQDDLASYRFEAAILDQVAAQDNLVARILYWETRQTADQVFGVQVQTYIPGAPVEGYPGVEQSRAILRAGHDLQRRLCAATARLDTSPVPHMLDIIRQRYLLVRDCPIKVSAARLLAHKRFVELLSSPARCVLHGDLWYRNIHLEQSGEKITARFIDFEPVIQGPGLLQPAILFSSCFLISSLLFEPAAFNLDQLISYWPEPVERDDLLLLMLAFPVALGMLKEIRFSQVPGRDPQDHRETMDLFENSVRVISGLAGLELLTP